MHILTAVFYSAPHGGLHENILSTVKHCIQAKHKVTVLCLEGEFKERLICEGANVITTDFSSIDNDIERLSKYNFDIIHTHPFLSREVTVPLARRLKIPLFITFHGMYSDRIKEYIDEVSLVFAVSHGIKNYLQEIVPDHKEKIFVVPNGVNRNLFKSLSEHKFKDNKDDKINISLVTRLDPDKEFILQIFYKAIEYTGNHHKNKVRWTIVGDGSIREEVKRKVSEILTENGHEVNFVGWKTGEDLLRYYINSDIVMAPGRCALEAMSCGKPVIAIGSKVYVGLIDNKNWLKGVYTNFGGLGKKLEDYKSQSVEKELEKLINSKKTRDTLGELGISIVKQFYDEQNINEEILKFYTLFSTQSH